MAIFEGDQQFGNIKALFCKWQIGALKGGRNFMFGEFVSILVVWTQINNRFSKMATGKIHDDGEE